MPLLKKESLQGSGPNQVVLKEGQGLGQAFLAGSWDGRTKPATYHPSGHLAAETERNVVSLAWPMLPAGGGVVPRPFRASLDPARAWRQSQEVGPMGGKAQPALTGG